MTMPEAVVARAKTVVEVTARRRAPRERSVAFLGAVELGLIYGLVALGVSTCRSAS